MTKLPTLTKVRELGGDEFEKLMHQLLLAYADDRKFAYEPHGKSGAADGGSDGLARQGGVPGERLGRLPVQVALRQSQQRRQRQADHGFRE